MEEENINEKPMPLKKKVDLLLDEREKTLKKKNMKIPRRAKVSRGRLKKGYIGVIKIGENGNISGEKQILEDSTIRLQDKTYHAIKGNEIGMWEGKYPVVVLATWKKNPIDLKRQKDEKNETHGQKYIMARMLGDTIKVKSAGGAKGLIYVLIAAAVIYGGYMIFTGQL